jgi:hypothetical protein
MQSPPTKVRREDDPDGSDDTVMDFSPVSGFGGFTQDMDDLLGQEQADRDAQGPVADGE